MRDASWRLVSPPHFASRTPRSGRIVSHYLLPTALSPARPLCRHPILVSESRRLARIRRPEGVCVCRVVWLSWCCSFLVVASCFLWYVLVCSPSSSAYRPCVHTQPLMALGVARYFGLMTHICGALPLELRVGACCSHLDVSSGTPTYRVALQSVYRCVPWQWLQVRDCAAGATERDVGHC